MAQNTVFPCRYWGYGTFAYDVVYTVLSIFQEVILKRAADLAEALYTMPRNNQLSLSLPRSPCPRDRDGNNMSTTAGSVGTGFNPYTGQLAVTVHDHGVTGQWNDGKSRASVRFRDLKT